MSTEHGPENDPNIYLHPDGSYRDYPPETDESGTLSEAGEDIGGEGTPPSGDESGAAPVVPDSGQTDDPGTEDTARTRVQ